MAQKISSEDNRILSYNRMLLNSKCQFLKSYNMKIKKTYFFITL